MFGLGLRLWVGSLDSLQNIQSFGKIKTFVSCEKKLEFFWLRIHFFREDLDMFSRNLFVNRSHTFLPNQIESFCKTSKRFAEKHKEFFFFLQNSRIAAKVNGSC